MKSTFLTTLFLGLVFFSQTSNGAVLNKTFNGRIATCQHHADVGLRAFQLQILKNEIGQKINKLTIGVTFFDCEENEDRTIYAFKKVLGDTVLKQHIMYWNGELGHVYSKLLSFSIVLTDDNGKVLSRTKIEDLDHSNIEIILNIDKNKINSEDRLFINGVGEEKIRTSIESEDAGEVRKFFTGSYSVLIN